VNDARPAPRDAGLFLRKAVRPGAAVTCVTPIPSSRRVSAVGVLPPGRTEGTVKQFFLQGEIDGVPVRWLVLRSTDGAVTWLDEHLVQEVVSSTWATTTFSDLEVKEATDPMPNVGAEPPAYTVTLGSGTLIVGYVVKSRLGFF
jgi:hypothetical protein